MRAFMQSTAGRQARRWGLCLATVAALVGAPAVVRADNLDKELMNKSQALFAELQKRGCQNVGVLKFMVKKGKGEPSFNAGALNHNIASRLENALILANDPNKPIGIIRDATAVALAQAPKATYGTAAGREELFKVSYPLAWGKDKVNADAFLTGLVELSADMQTTTINIAYFDRKATKLQDLEKFTVKTDRNILVDSGQSFALAKRSLMKRGPIEDLEKASAEAAQNLDNSDGKSTTTDPNTTTEPNALFRMVVIADGKVVDQVRDPSNPGEHKLTSNINPGQTVELKITNLIDEKLGVVLKVNGESTINKETATMDQCTRWILEPKGEYVVRGFYMDKPGGGTNLEKFKVVAEGDFGPRTGFIDLAFFRNGQAPVPPHGEELQFSLRGLAKRSLGTASAPANLLEAKKQVRQGSALKPRGILTGGGTLEPVDLKTDQLQFPQLAGNGHLEYHIK